MTVHVIGGGTFSYVRTHLALAAPAFGATARAIHAHYSGTKSWTEGGRKMFALTNSATLHLTKMADSGSALTTNQDVADLIDRLVADPATKVVYLNAALCDYEGSVLGSTIEDDGLPTLSGKYVSRLRTADGIQQLQLEPAAKLAGRIRAVRKDVFAVGFKTTSGATPDEQYAAALNLLKASSLNLVLANDVVTRHAMVVAPEETRYYEGERPAALRGLIDMVEARRHNTFTRSTVVPAPLVSFQKSELVPDSLRQVVNRMTAAGAYKPFRGSTAGHFAARLHEGSCLTSRRKTDYTQPGSLDLVQIEYDGLDHVTAYGAKPSVGGQSQRIVFDQHPGLDCIVHAHVPLRPESLGVIPVAPQEPYECGSHQCGANTSTNLAEVEPGIWAVMLAGHGPNVVFGRDEDPERVWDFVNRHFDLSEKTGGLIAEPA